MRVAIWSLMLFLTVPMLSTAQMGLTSLPSAPDQKASMVLSPSTASLTLDELIREAEESNPEIRAAREGLQAARERISPAGALPEPMINFGQMNVASIVPFTTLGEEGFSEIYIGISQEFPFYGKRDLRERVAGEEADAENWSYEFTGLRVISELKAAYYDLSYWHRALVTLSTNMALLENFAETAAALYKVGKGTQADVLRAETELSVLQGRIETARERKVVAEARINALLNRPPESPLGRPAPVEKASLSHDFEELLRMATERFPLLRRQDELVQARRYELQLAEKGKYPDFGLVFAYHNRGALPDYWTIGGTARIPIYYRRKQLHEIREADARLAADRERYESLLAELRFQVKDQYLAAVTSERLLRLFDRTIIPQETLTLEATSASYEVGSVDFLSVIDSLIKLVNDQLSYYRYLTDYQKALARLEPLVGGELTGR